jgi:hypothetical protein
VFKGELSTEVAPTILFHYSLLFDEAKVLGIRFLKWKEALPQTFYRVGGSRDVNLGLLVPASLEKKVESLITDEPINVVRTYREKFMKADLTRLAHTPWYKIATYYDNDPQRGQLFGSVWRNL